MAVVVRWKRSVNSYSVAERINSDVNASVTYKTDLAQYDKPVLGDESYTPMGWVQYCKDNPGECKN